METHGLSSTLSSRKLGLTRSGRARGAGVALAGVALMVGSLVSMSASAWALPIWSVSSSPNPNPTGYNSLLADSCGSATSCKAVGFYEPSSGIPRTLIESWNGATWSVSTSLNKGAETNELTAVSCVSATSCKAVGYYETSGSSIERTLIESWNGTAWSVSTSTNPSPVFNLLDGVSCISATSCKAVGTYQDTGSASRNLVESWNGTTWSTSTSPNNGTGTNQLNAVSCASATTCKAVGFYKNTFDITRTLTESWNGSTWSLQTSPNKGPDDAVTGNDDLTGVSCVSSSSCKAVGYYDDYTLAESWNGSTWSLETSPNEAIPGYSQLQAVSCKSTTSCQAVGYYEVTSSGDLLTLIESWNGTAWSISTSANANTMQNVLYGVSCVTTTSCEAAGLGADVTLIEQYG